MAAKGKRKNKLIIKVIIPLAIAVTICAALLITNIFVPVKYLSAYFVSSKNRVEGELRVNFLNVGFGDSALVELPDGKVMLIDGGDGAYSHELSLLKYLNSRGVDTIDYLICTSIKDEHCGGLKEIVKYKTVKKAFIPYCTNTRINDEYHAFVAALKDKKVAYEYAGVGKGYCNKDYDLFFTFLSPVSESSPGSEYSDMNSSPTAANIEKASVVTWLQYGDTAFAFTSDARGETLKSIADKYEAGKLLEEPFCEIEGYSVKLEGCDVLTVPAHGGPNGSNSSWYKLTNPRCAIVSVGSNFADYPSVSGLADICKYVEPLFTNEKGNIVIKATAQDFTL